MNLNNTFYDTGFILCPLKTSANLKFSELFQGVKKETSALKWVKDSFKKYVSRMVIFICAALVLSMHSSGLRFYCFLI